MMSRVLVVLALGVVGLLVALWIMILRDEPPGVSLPTPVPSAPGAAPTAEVADRSSPSARSRVGARGMPVPRRPNAAGSSAPEPALSSERPEAPEPPQDAAPRERPPAFWYTLRDQVHDTETWLLECNERAQKQGIQLSGTAAYSFVITRKGDQIVIESTGTEYSGIPQPYSECMEHASRKMTFEELPEGVDSLIAYRKIVFENGTLKENWMTEFHTIRPAPSL